MDLDKLKAFKFEIPLKLDDFIKESEQKEKDLADILMKMEKLKI